MDDIQQARVYVHPTPAKGERVEFRARFLKDFKYAGTQTSVAEKTLNNHLIVQLKEVRHQYIVIS